MDGQWLLAKKYKTFHPYRGRLYAGVTGLRR
jgi:hypothetical protein